MNIYGAWFASSFIKPRKATNSRLLTCKGCMAFGASFDTCTLDNLMCDYVNLVIFSLPLPLPLHTTHLKVRSHSKLHWSGLDILLKSILSLEAWIVACICILLSLRVSAPLCLSWSLHTLQDLVAWLYEAAPTSRRWLYEFLVALGAFIDIRITFDDMLVYSSGASTFKNVIVDHVLPMMAILRQFWCIPYGINFVAF